MAWAFPHRSGDAPGGCRAGIIDFSMIFGNLGGGVPWRAPPQTFQNQWKINDSRSGASWYVPRATCKRPGLFGLIFHRFFNSNLPPTWPQLGSQNPTKSLKNQCQDALYFELYLLIDFFSIFAPNLDLLDLKKRGFSFGKTQFFEKSPFEVNIDFWSHFGFNFASFWHPKSTKILPKIDSKRH